MKIRPEMTINEVLAIDEDKMLKTLSWLVPELERLQYPHPRRSIVGAVTVEQAARIAGMSLIEMLYALNLAAGESEGILAKEFRAEHPPRQGPLGGKA